MCDTETAVEEARRRVGVLLTRLGLELHPEKTRLVDLSRGREGFDFLGQHVRKYNGEYLIKPSKKNVKTFLTDIRKVMKANKQATAYGLIATLNPTIRG